TQGAPPKVIPFQVSDRESAAGTLTVTATSSNPSLVPNTTAALALAANADGTNRTLTITPTAGQNGVAVITMRCTDPGNNTVTNSFSYDVAPQYGILFSDNFDSFADGTSLSQSSASQWFQFSGTLYQLIVSNKMAVINEANSEDIYAPLANAPFTTNNGAVLYYGFKLTVAKLPSAAGDYFMLLNDTTTSGFKAKAFVASGNAAPGSYRVGIANGGSAPNVEFPQDLSLNSSYYVVVRYIVGSASTTLWINPTAETSASVTALDGTPPQEIDRIALRESSLGEGIEYIDNLVASTAFTDVAPALIVNPIANRTTPVSTSTGPIPFIVTDKSVSPDTCTYGGASDNQSLVANGNITFGGSGTNRTVTIVPVAGQQGFANITINVSDTAGNANTTAFMLTVGAPATNGIVISQVYPGGGNAGATYSSKFVELFNHTANPVSLNNWSLQYAASTGSTWSAGNFANVTVAPYSYYLVALSTNGTTGAALPVTPNFTLTAINPSQAAGKIALCNSQGPLSGASPVSTPTVMDFVGYGTGTTAYEGSGPVNWTTANANAMFRASSGCVDTGDNAADFTSAAVSPRNSATAQNICVSASPTMRAFVNGNNIVIAWPSSTVGYNLETATTVNQFPWNVVGGATVVGNEYQVSVPINGGAYYRLKH
ncbi:MAG: lamin tail domain-containing protein, partial [Limisphaerales bacterium]